MIRVDHNDSLARSRGRGAGSILGVLAAAGIACNLLVPPSLSTPTRGPTSSPVPRLVSVFDDSEAWWAALHQAVGEAPQDVIEEATPLLASADSRTRFAAVYALGLAVDADQADLLLPALEDPNPGLRILAGGALIGLGRVESIPVLIAALGSDDELPYLDPPTRVWSIAHAGLAFYTGQDFGFLVAVRSGDEAARQASAAAWNSWWVEVAPDLTWDANSERFIP